MPIPPLMLECAARSHRQGEGRLEVQLHVLLAIAAGLSAETAPARLAT